MLLLQKEGDGAQPEEVLEQHFRCPARPSHPPPPTRGASPPMPAPLHCSCRCAAVRLEAEVQRRRQHSRVAAAVRAQPLLIVQPDHLVQCAQRVVGVGVGVVPAVAAQATADVSANVGSGAGPKPAESSWSRWQLLGEQQQQPQQGQGQQQQGGVRDSDRSLPAWLDDDADETGACMRGRAADGGSHAVPEPPQCTQAPMHPCTHATMHASHQMFPPPLWPAASQQQQRQNQPPFWFEYDGLEAVQREQQQEGEEQLSAPQLQSMTGGGSGC